MEHGDSGIYKDSETELSSRGSTHIEGIGSRKHCIRKERNAKNGIYYIIIFINISNDLK